MTKSKKFRIDWVNHAVGFLGALLGIYIAFRLENYREEKKEKERVTIVKEALRKEIEDNLKIYKTTIDDLSGWLEYKDFLDKRRDNKAGGWAIGANELSLMSKKTPNRFSDAKEIKKINDTLKVYDLNFQVDVAPTSRVSTSGWKTAVSSGVLSSMDYSLTTKLAQVYDWTEKDIGTSEKELFENFLGINKEQSLTDFKTLVMHYRNILRVQTLKYDQINRIKSDIDWSK
jgi:hypothetical protein